MTPEQLAVAVAAHTARRGELAGALQLLEGLESGEALDLRARVLAQLGRWQEADDTWNGLVPADSALAGRALARRVLAGRSRQRPVARPAAAGALAVLAVGAITLGTAVAVERPEVVAAQPQPQPQPSVSPRTVTVTPPELAQRIAAEKAAAARLDAIAATVAMPGVTVRREPGAVRVVFDRGLFTSGTTFADGSVQLLTQLAPKLERVPGITVVGQSVAVPGSEASGSSTALARARVVAQELARTGNLPLTRLTLASGDQARPLLPGAARNRTVSLLLTA
ncbi:hypothetical protein ABZS29_25960 [Kribbella sp. NPDC005582]|uniref:hypothetical protein n=1 Tax=Kribbella sp. NPDC005582 TaxID=3156893 RepID=UPI0033A5B1C1